LYDQVCTKTTYATPDATNWILAFPVTEETRASASTLCATGAPLRASRLFYDGQATLGQTPTDGNVTREQHLYDTTNDLWTTANRTFDGLGRVRSSTDPNGNASTIAYSPDYVPGSNPYPTSVTTTAVIPNSPVNLPGDDHVTVTTLDPQHVGSPTSVTDPNNKVTTLAYDPLGRLSKVWLPTESTSATASYQYFYNVVENPVGYGLEKPAQITALTLQTEGGAGFDEFNYEYTVFDGMLRPRQTGTFSPSGSGFDGLATISQTTYDTRGLVASQTLPEGITGAAWVLATLSPPANDTTYVYDERERPITETFNAAGAARWTTARSYTNDTVTVDHPVGGDTRTIVNGLGQTVSVGEWGGYAWQSATYGYNAVGDLTSIVDPLANRITYTIDALGRRIAMDDPDAGDWTYTYDANGNQQTVTDSTNATLYTAYDSLNRPVERRETNSTGTLLASWNYDAPGEKGLLDKSTRIQAGTFAGSWVTDITGYDGRNRPLGKTYTVPASAGIGLAGTYAYSYEYDAADHQTAVTYPAAGGLDAEKVTTDYTWQGLPVTLTGQSPPAAPTTTTEYISATTYDNRLRVQDRTLGAAGDPNRILRTYAYNNDQRLTTWTATKPSAGGTIIQDDKINFDALGNVVMRKDRRAGINQWECFGYDARNRLASAYTTTNPLVGFSCGSANTSGPAPYDHTYTYSADGKITSRTEQGITSTYTYPTQGAGSTQPHAVTDITGTTNDCNGGTAGTPDYCYDANGNLTGRPGTSGNQALTWDPEHRLSTVTDGTDTTTFVYDPDGTRLIRQTPADTTLYLDRHELNRAGAVVSAKRYYQLGGMTIGVRDSSTGHLTYLLGDQLGSTTVSVSAAGGTPVVQRYLPYGAPRSTTGGSEVTDRGWIGQTRDTSTGLQYLNARYYDPGVARFLATDPLADLARPATLDAYGYAGDSPITNSDPTGLLMPVGSGGTGDNTNGSVYLPDGSISGGCGAGCASGGGGGGSGSGGGSSPTPPPPGSGLAELADSIGTAADVSENGLQLLGSDGAGVVVTAARKIGAAGDAFAVSMTCIEAGIGSQDCTDSALTTLTDWGIQATLVNNPGTGMVYIYIREVVVPVFARLMSDWEEQTGGFGTTEPLRNDSAFQKGWDTYYVDGVLPQGDPYKYYLNGQGFAP
jgi:RHS repeat-associated protein